MARIFLGHDMSDRIYSIDEKPMHFNEGASKNKNTLEIQGAPAVKLKENHAASRQRLSVMTCATSNLAAINQAGGLPVLRVYGDEGLNRKLFRVLGVLATATSGGASLVALV